MCIPFFHRWTKWSEVKTRQERVKAPIMPASIAEDILYEPQYEVYERVERYQERACEYCGVHQERIISVKCYS